MRILHLISGGDVGGAKTHVLSLLRGLKEQHQVKLVCFMEGPFALEARELGIPTLVIPGNNILSTVSQLASLIREDGYQLVHCHGSRANLTGYLLKKRMPLTVITTVHSDPRLDYLGRPLSNMTYGVLNRHALRHLDNWVCVSRQLRDMMVESGSDPTHTFVINNGVDFSDLSCKLTREEFWTQAGLDVQQDSVVFGIAARISPVKDMGTLIRAFAKAASQEPRMRLAIAGDGEQRQELEALAAKLCPKGSYAFLGWLSDTASFYHALDVNMLTSLSEGLPYAIPEGARMSCATIATRVGAVPRIVINGETGLLVEPGDVNSLSERMLRVTRDDALRHSLGDAIFRKVKAEFSAEATVRTQVEIYETVLRRMRRVTGQKDGVLICGAYGKGNAGDETILESIVQQLLSRDPDLPITVMSQTPNHTACRVGVNCIYTFSFGRMRRQMRKAQLFISGGGSLIQDVTSTRSLLFYLYTIRAAHKLGCKVMMYGCGIGPVNKARNRRLTGNVINANVDLVTLREPGSLRELEDMGVNRPEIRLTADPALLRDVPASCLPDYEAYCKSAGLNPGKQEYCLFALRPWVNIRRYQPAFTAAAEYVYKRYGLIPVFFQLEPNKDRPITMTVAETVHCPKLVLPPLEDGALISALMRDMKMVISMRLHALIFASAQGTPVVGISYDPKVSSFMDYMEQDNYVALDEVTDGVLCDLIDSAYANETTEKAILTRLRNLAGQNGLLARKLISGDLAEDL